MRSESAPSTCMNLLAASKLHWGKRKRQGISETEPCHLHRKQCEAPFALHVPESVCMTLKKKCIVGGSIMLVQRNMEKHRQHAKVHRQPVNVTCMSKGPAIDKIFFAPFFENLIIFLFTLTALPLFWELISCSKYINQGDVVTLCTWKAFHCSSGLARQRLVSSPITHKVMEVHEVQPNRTIQQSTSQNGRFRKSPTEQD